MKKRFALVLFLSGAGLIPSSYLGQGGRGGRRGEGCSLEAPELPLRTEGRWIVDRRGRRFKLNSVSWYGAEEKDFAPAGLEIESLPSIARRIRCMGFNSVRLPWSNELYETNPAVSDSVLAANPQLQGKQAMDVLDAVVDALAQQGLVIILDNHMSNADWCCSNTDGNSLWYNGQYPETSWIADWKGIARRYKNQPAVAAVDLRNEPRARASWGGNPQFDWRAAAERGGNAVLSVNPDLLVIVEGVNYASDLTGVARLPIVLNEPDRLVYSAHDYPWYHNRLSSYTQLKQQLEHAWGYILAPGQPDTAPVWVGEFGTCHTASSCLKSSSPGPYGFWLTNFLEYLANNDVDWSYWALNGTEAAGRSRRFGSEETFGVLDPYWNAPAVPDELAPPPSVNLLAMLQTVMGPTQGPELASSYPPLVAITNPVNDALFASGSSITLSADAATPQGRVEKVAFYANEKLIGSATNAPFSIQWGSVPPGKYSLVAVATVSGRNDDAQGDRRESGPVRIVVEDYSARRPNYGTSIGIDFVGYWGTAPGTPMASTEIAGVVAQSSWNNAYGNSGSVSSLMDSTGAATDAIVTWTSNNMYFTPIPDSPGDHRMMKGYQDTTNSVPTLIRVDNIPESFGRYDVLVYFDGANGGNARAANYRIVTSDGETNSGFSGCPHGVVRPGTIITGLDAPSADFSGVFTLAAGGSAGNFVLFPDCRGSGFTLLAVHGASTDSQYRAPVNGIQIVSIPRASVTADPSTRRASRAHSSARATLSGRITSNAVPVGPRSPR